MRISLALGVLDLVGLSFAECDPSPIVMPITNVVLSNGKRKRGIPGTVGTPAQNISFMIHSYLNDTWIYNSTDTFCDEDWTADRCSSLRGGLYNTKKSTTFTSRSNVHDAGGDPSDVQRTLGTHIWDNTWATDLLTVGNASISDYAIGMPGFDISGPFDRQSYLGLGHNSTLLQRLKDSKQIGSRSWSYWWGIDNSQSRSAMDGQFILGGYDAAKVSGSPLTLPLRNASASCQSGMTLSFTNILLNFPNGTSTDINPSSVITGCIEPDFPSVMTIPADPYFWAFQNITETGFYNKSLGTWWYTPVYHPDNVYPGDLQIQIQGGPSITIPNDVLVVPDQYTDSAGSVISNNSAADLLLGPLDGINKHDIPKIGLQFFSGAYLTVNLDNRTWSVWPAVVTTESDVVAIGEGSCDQHTNRTSDGVSPTASGVSKVSPDSTGSFLSTSAKVGIAVSASVVFLALSGLFAYLLWRKLNQKRKVTSSAPDRLFESYPDFDHKGQTKWQSARSSQNLVQELPSSKNSVSELKGDMRLWELPQHRGGQSPSTYVRENAFELPASTWQQI